jgi:hypothetical protein
MVRSDDDIREVDSLLVRHPIGQRYTVDVAEGLTDELGLSAGIATCDVAIS